MNTHTRIIVDIEMGVIMNEYIELLACIKSCPKSFQSNFVRDNASLVAEAASRGHISCLTAWGSNGGAWEITATGATFLRVYGGGH